MERIAQLNALPTDMDVVQTTLPHPEVLMGRVVQVTVHSLSMDAVLTG
jgi:hypothetical protein